jgi:hypothetical protein
MFRKLLAAVSTVALLADCTGITQVQKNVQAKAVTPIATAFAVDATSAKTLAQGDQINPAAASLRIPCYGNAAALATGLAASQGGLIFLPVEGALEGQELASSPNCQAVVGQLLVQVLQQNNVIANTAGLAVLGAGISTGGLIP